MSQVNETIVGRGWENIGKVSHTHVRAVWKDGRALTAMTKTFLETIREFNDDPNFEIELLEIKFNNN